MKRTIPCLLFLAIFCTHLVHAQEPRLMYSAKHLDSKENEAGINSIHFSPDKRFLATGARDGVVKIWDTKSGKLIYDLLTSDYSSSAFFSQEGKYLVTGESGLPATWTIATGKRKYQLPLDPEAFYGLIRSQTGKYFATTSNVTAAYIWNTETGKLVDSAGLTEDIRFLDNDRRIAYIIEESIILVREPGKTTRGSRLGSGQGFIQAYDLTKDGKTLFIQYENDLFEVWDVLKKQKLRSFNLPLAEPVYKQVALSASLQQVIAKEESGRIRSFSALDGKELFALDSLVSDYNTRFILDDDREMIVYPVNEHQHAVINLRSPGKLRLFNTGLAHIEHIRFSDDKSLMAYAWGNEAGIANLQDNSAKLLGLFSYTINKARIDSSGDMIATISDKLPEIKHWTYQTGGVIRNLFRNVDWYQHPHLLLDRKGSHLISYSQQNKSHLGLWDLQQAVKIDMIDTARRYVEEETQPVSGFFLDRKRQAVIVHEGYTRHYSLDKHQFITSGQSDLPSYSHISPLENFALADGDRYDSTTRLVLLHLQENNTKVETLPFFLKKVKQSRFSFDEKYLLIAGEDAVMSVWDITRRQVIKTIRFQSHIIDFCFSHNNEKLLVHTASEQNDAPSYDRQSQLSLYETKNWTLIHSWKNLGYTPEAILFSADDKSFFTSEEEFFTDNWNIATKLKTRQLTGSLAMDAGAYDPFSRYILTHTPSLLYIWDPRNLELVYSLNLIDSTGYLARIKGGYFMSPPDAARKLHYVTPDLKVVTFEQLDIKYNRPDKVLEALGSKDTALINAYRKAYQKRIAKLGIDTASFREGFTVPEADIMNRESIAYEQASSQLALQLKGKAVENLDRVNVWVNEVPLFTQQGINLRRTNRKTIDTTFRIELSQGQNSIETSVIDVNGTESYRMPLIVNYIPAQPKQEKTWFIGIGIDRFADDRYNLQYSVKDIRDLAKKLKLKYGEAIHIDTLFNTQVNKANIKALKEQLLESSVNDKVIIAYSGHGLLSSGYDYYLSTFTVNFEKPETEGLPYEELESLLDNIPARKKLMLIDACHSGEVDKDELLVIDQRADSLGLAKGFKPVGNANHQVGLKNSFELMQSLFVNVGKSTGATVISAAAGNQFALERGDLENGVFTFSILEAMEKYPTLKVSELTRLVAQRVEELTGGLQKPTTRHEQKATDWNAW